MSESVPQRQRRYPRASSAKNMFVAWKSPSRTSISRISVVGLGGMFIHEADPPPPGTLLQLLFETPVGQVRARAAVRSAEVGRGMGVEFMQMRQQERARLANMIKHLLP
ncbi:MAG TPA: PilZ domain-containing protein [Candidatus Acidoferrales bacterium]|nr:PilZ domain-containing protein [Candidatus Acidoferrales bacterium]